MTDRYYVMLSLPLPEDEATGFLDEDAEGRVEAALKGAAGTGFDGTGTGFGNRDFFAVTSDPAAVASALTGLLPPEAELRFRRLAPEEDPLEEAS
jgi:hypothetical protein